ncbi:MAG: hypothetical protein AB7F74_04370 [Parvibaculaceae bacterium]
MSKPPQRPEHRSDEDTEVGKVEKLGEADKKQPAKRDGKEKK